MGQTDEHMFVLSKRKTRRRGGMVTHIAESIAISQSDSDLRLDRSRWEVRGIGHDAIHKDETSSGVVQRRLKKAKKACTYGYLGVGPQVIRSA